MGWEAKLQVYSLLSLLHVPFPMPFLDLLPQMVGCLTTYLKDRIQLPEQLLLAAFASEELMPQGKGRMGVTLCLTPGRRALSSRNLLRLIRASTPNLI